MLRVQILYKIIQYGVLIQKNILLGALIYKNLYRWVRYFYSQAEAYHVLGFWKRNRLLTQGFTFKNY